MNIFEIAGFEILGKLYEVWMEYPNVPIRNKFAEHGFYVYADRILHKQRHTVSKDLKWMFYLSHRVNLYGNGMFSLRLGNTSRWLHWDLVHLKIGEKVPINLVELRTYFLDDILETFVLDNSITWKK